jgi:HK97 family phage prohead protease
MENKSLEIRSAEIRNISNSRTIEGYAMVFNSESEDLGFREIIKPNAVTQETIDKSDVFCRFNHDEEKVLARSNHGKGSLSLKIDDRGLKYSFDVPNTDLGNTLLEYINRGEIDSSSFAFAVSPDEGSDYWYKDNSGIIHREINKIDYLVDVSPVWYPAYTETTVNLLSSRALEQSKLLNMEETKSIDQLNNEDNNNMKDEKQDPEVEDPKKMMEDPKSEDTPEEDPKVDTSNSEDPKVEDDPKKEPKEEEKEDPEMPIDNEEDNMEEKSCGNTGNKKQERSLNTSIITNNKHKMNSNFSLISAIRSIAENRSLDDVALAVKEAGVEEMRKAGVSAAGQIILPVEKRDITVADEGADVVATNLYDIVEPLRAKNVLVAAGAKFISGLTSNVQIPVMTGSNVGWAGEVAEAAKGGASFDSFILSPKRLTAYVDLSKMLLVQDTVGIENMIRQDLINAINDKLEGTILGVEAGSATQPAGMFAGVTPVAVTDFASVVALEEVVEEANVINPIKYIVSPKARANFRNMQKGTKNNTYLAYENGELDGTPVFSTSHVVSGDFVVGDFTNLAIGQFGGIDITVDPYTKAAEGQIRLVVNAYFDSKVLRANAFAFGKFGA